MGGRIEGSGMDLKGVPSVIVAMGRWHPNGIGQGDEAEVIGVFGGEDRLAKATARCKEVLSGESPRAEAWIVGDFFVQ